MKHSLLVSGVPTETSLHESNTDGGCSWLARGGVDVRALSRLFQTKLALCTKAVLSLTSTHLFTVKVGVVITLLILETCAHCDWGLYKST